MTKEELNNLIVLNKNYKTGEPLFLVSYPYLFKITYDETDSIKGVDAMNKRESIDFLRETSVKCIEEEQK